MFVNLASCYCENINGFGASNGIICGSSGNYQKVTKCPNDLWCTGHSNESSPVESTMDLCENGMVAKG